MDITRESIETHVSKLLTQLAGDWEYEGEVTKDSLLFTGLGLQSLDVVVLGNTLQEHFGAVIPYADLLVRIGQREFRDISVGEWVDFTYQHLKEHGSE